MPDYKKQKPNPKGGGRRPEGQQVGGSYFLSLEIENVRCFSQ